LGDTNSGIFVIGQLHLVLGSEGNLAEQSSEPAAALLAGVELALLVAGRTGGRRLGRLVGAGRRLGNGFLAGARRGQGNAGRLQREQGRVTPRASLSRLFPHRKGLVNGEGGGGVVASADRSVDGERAAENQRPTPEQDGRLHVRVVVGGGRGAPLPVLPLLQAVEAERGGGAEGGRVRPQSPRQLPARVEMRKGGVNRVAGVGEPRVGHEGVATYRVTVGSLLPDRLWQRERKAHVCKFATLKRPG